MTSCDIMLDSGAYSAHTRGLKIELPDYVAFLRQHPIFQQYFSLDVIPGKNGVRFCDPGAAAETYRRQQVMKDAGLRPIAVVHRHDPRWLLERYLRDGEPRVALAPLPMEQPAVGDWFSECFEKIPSTTRVHGLGTTAALMLQRFPFDTVDSTSWFEVAANYCVLLPRFDRNGPDYRHSARIVSVSDRAAHFDNLDVLVKQQAETFFELCGTTLGELRISKLARMRVCLRFFQGLAAASNVRIFYVSCVHDYSILQALQQTDARTHLLSFADLKDNYVAMVRYAYRRW
jgi:hypothetical protein